MRPVSLAEIVIGAIQGTLEGVHISVPGRIVSYDADKQVADVQPMVKQRFQDAETGEVVYRSYPVCQNCPVKWPRSGSAALTFPLAADDECELQFSEASMSEWRSTGQESEPIDAERFGMSNPTVLPGLSSMAKAFASASATKVVLGFESSGSRIEITPGPLGAIDAGPGGAFLAHAVETIAVDAAIAAAVTSVLFVLAGFEAAIPADGSPVTNSVLKGYAAGLSAAATSFIGGTMAASIAAETPTLPTLVLKGK